MAAELVVALVRLNLAMSAAILALLMVRAPLRALVGPRLAYTAWALVPCAAVASVIPARTGAAGGQVYALAMPSGLVEWLHAPQVAAIVLAAWLTGLLVAAGLLSVRQTRFLALARQGKAGPAVVGVITPRIVVPAGYWTAFSAEEHRLIRAHERAHIERGDPRAIALIVTLQHLAWFNPLVHFAARRAREDQELACDATVLETLNETPRRYAQTLLKSQLVRAAPPLGCQWRREARHPLEVRIRALGRRAPRAEVRTAGAAAIAFCAVCLSLGVWLARPPAPPPASFTYRDPRAVTQVQVDLTPVAAAGAVAG